MKEIKNKIELSGMHEAHIRDCGAAVTSPLVLLIENTVNLSVIYLDGWKVKFIQVQ